MPPTEPSGRAGQIVAVCTSENKRTAKCDVGQARLIEEFGLEGDAHAGMKSAEMAHRQVSLIAQEDIDSMKDKLPDLVPGSFGENLTTSGLDLSALVVGDRLEAGEALLEVSQLGKVCHSRCDIYYKTGDCIMPQKGVFCRVLRGGTVRSGDKIKKQDKK